MSKEQFKVLICLFIVLLTGCSSKKTEQPGSAKVQTVQSQKNTSRKIILFIPGYYGSRLKNAETGKLLWAKASNFLFSNEGLSENIPGTNIGDKKKLVTDGILDSVTIVPRLFHYDAYEDTLEHLQKFADENDHELHTMDYDWRDDFINCLKVIDAKIHSLNLKETDELTVIAHSMGGLLMSYYIRYGSQDVENAVEDWRGLNRLSKLVLVAPPLHGLMILFRDIGEGTSRGFNRTLLSSLDYSTFKSSYFFLPDVGDDVAKTEEGKMVNLKIHEIENWEINDWGPFKFAAPEERPIVREFISKLMKRSKKFHELLKAPVQNEPSKKIPLLHLWGVGNKTKEIATVFKNKKGQIDYRFDSSGEVDGDGTVTKNSGRSLEYFKKFHYKGREEKDGHLEILSDKDSQKTIHDFLLN